MTTSQELYQQVSHLSPMDKLRLAELLLADLDNPDPEIDAIWREEVQKRWRGYKGGGLKTVSYETVMQKYK
ncbi:addiction module protein [Methyloglobulus sp.]|uniref:addiction module protein n=1 Tax=Methyloglobulus sp. TaxID=2518622 RepID=UPI0032B74178